jgi:hypothetical protein
MGEEEEDPLDFYLCIYSNGGVCVWREGRRRRRRSLSPIFF